MKFRKKPVVVDAIQYFPSMPMYEISRLFGGLNESDRTFTRQGDTLLIETLEGVMCAMPGDWIIRGVKGVLSLQARYI